MTTPQQFGEYLLFRRLSSDGLGETFRAGRIGSQGIERVVLLRLFNGTGIEPESLWRTIADSMGLHRILQNPHIGDGADVGRVGSTPYVAYEYVSGKNLAELLNQARARGFQIPTEHALFILERITFGLSAAFSTRHRDQRVQHGFLVPEQALLSNEGEVRLVGFESAPGLREFLKAAPIREAFGPYLAPEIVPGTEPSPTDDVFSLGSLLYELLTGNRLSHPPDGNFDSAIDDAVLAAEEKPLPPQLRALLKSSLAPRAQRIGDVQQWQQAFGRFIAEAHYSPTTFNLAFFMHTLFGGEIEQETLDIAREKATQVDVAALARVDEPTPGPSDTVLIPPGKAADDRPRTGAAASAGTGYASAQYGGARGKGANWKVLAPLIAVALGAGLAAAYYWRTTSAPATDLLLADTEMREEADPLADDLGAGDLEGGDLGGDAPAGALEPAVDGTPSLGLEVAGGREDEAALPPDSVDTSGVSVPPTPEEVEAQIEQLVDDRTNRLEARYEEELAALRQQLEEARLAQQAAAQAEAPAAGDARPLAASSPPARTGEPPATAAPADDQPAGDAAARTDSPVAASPPVAEQQGAAASAERVQTAPSEAAEQAETVPPSPAPPPAVGDLVEMGPGVERPRMVGRPQPRYPPAASRLNKQADVQLRLLIDENGSVARIEPVGEKVGFGFDEAAAAAARGTRWVPATKLGVRVKMWVDLKISFRP